MGNLFKYFLKNGTYQHVSSTLTSSTMFPVQVSYRFGYKQGDRTWYGIDHKGVDLIIPKATPLYMPKYGEILDEYWGPQGGYRQEFMIDGAKHRFLHLNHSVVQSGFVEEGTLIAYSGNTGLLTTAPHLHWDIWDGDNWIDPMKILWDSNDMTDEQIERLEDALGINKTGNFDCILDTVKNITKENGKVTQQRDHYKDRMIEEEKAKVDKDEELQTCLDEPKLSMDEKHIIVNSMIKARESLNEAIDKFL